MSACIKPWRHIDELGEITYKEDGSRQWTLNPGYYGHMRLFLIYPTTGNVETHYGYIDENGALCAPNGDPVGWMWCDAEYFMDLPAELVIRATGGRCVVRAVTG